MTVATLADWETVVGIQDSGDYIAYFVQLLRKTPEEFAILQVSTAYALQSLEMGADGFVPGGANVFPELLATVAVPSRCSPDQSCDW
ncbi:dihydrodipicolinate synthase family protein [Halosimplex amylolyticum]|uniref:dihydrodipicolinate synthase family protein n=1 Tax=Halosimplex amylolyticum TaxID=3396616 RepID=UPI003F54AD56